MFKDWHKPNLLRLRLQRNLSQCSPVCAPLDINDFREGKGGNLQELRDVQHKRFQDPAEVDRVVSLDMAWRNAVFKVEALQRDFNAHNKRIGQLKKEGGDTSALQLQSKDKKSEVDAAKRDTQTASNTRNVALGKIGNYIHKSVPISNDEADNTIVKSWGTPRKQPNLYNHVDIVSMLDIVDQNKGATVAGSRGYFLKGAGLFLNQALIQYALHHGYCKGLQPIMTPFLMRQTAMTACAQLSQFDEELYKVVGEGEDKYLIATAEQPLCALHQDEWYEEKDLPLKYIGYSSCFRREAGSHGRDTAGIFRVHQFEKVEQFVVTSPSGDASWHAFEEMMTNTEEFYQNLKLPYRVMNIVSGALNDAAAKKYDLEAWFPAAGAYRELVSCSNCLDYQARALNARMRPSGPEANQHAKKEFAHMLNCTMTATERTLCCILENYQTPEGIMVPDVLQPYLPNAMEFLPFKIRK